MLLPIAALGIPCVGVDASPAMLAVLRAKNPPPTLELVEARMETFDLGGAPLPADHLPFRAFQHLLDVDAQLAALANSAGTSRRAECSRSTSSIRSWRG